MAKRKASKSKKPTAAAKKVDNPTAPKNSSPRPPRSPAIPETRKGKRRRLAESKESKYSPDADPNPDPLPITSPTLNAAATSLNLLKNISSHDLDELPAAVPKLGENFQLPSFLGDGAGKSFVITQSFLNAVDEDLDAVDGVPKVNKAVVLEPSSGDDFPPPPESNPKLGLPAPSFAGVTGGRNNSGIFTVSFLKDIEKQAHPSPQPKTKGILKAPKHSASVILNKQLAQQTTDTPRSRVPAVRPSSFDSKVEVMFGSGVGLGLDPAGGLPPVPAAPRVPGMAGAAGTDDDDLPPMPASNPTLLGMTESTLCLSGLFGSSFDRKLREGKSVSFDSKVSFSPYEEGDGDAPRLVDVPRGVSLLDLQPRPHTHPRAAAAAAAVPPGEASPILVPQVGGGGPALFGGPGRPPRAPGPLPVAAAAPVSRAGGFRIPSISTSSLGFIAPTALGLAGGAGGDGAGAAGGQAGGGSGAAALAAEALARARATAYRRSRIPRWLEKRRRRRWLKDRPSEQAGFKRAQALGRSRQNGKFQKQDDLFVSVAALVPGGGGAALVP